MKKASPKTPAKPVKAIADYPTFTGTKSVSEITNTFCAKQAKKFRASDGDSSCVSDFGTLARMVAQNYSNGFSLNDFLSLSRTYDSDPVLLAELFHSWIEELTTANLLKSQFSCYSWPVYKFSNQ